MLVTPVVVLVIVVARVWPPAADEAAVPLVVVVVFNFHLPWLLQMVALARAIKPIYNVVAAKAATRGKAHAILRATGANRIISRLQIRHSNKWANSASPKEDFSLVTGTGVR